MVKIVTDSTSDLTPEIAAALGITVVPLYVNFGTESYRDGIDLRTEEFYRKLSRSSALPTTSTPNINSYLQVFSELSDQTDDILVITISSKLSATWDIALKAQARWQGSARVTVIDSKSAIVGLALIVVAAAKAAGEGASLNEVVALTLENINRVDFRIAFDTLEYLKKGGRIGSAQALMGSMLHFHPVLTIRNGVIEAVTRLRSRSKVQEYLCNFAASYPNVCEIAVEDATTPDEADLLCRKIGDSFPQNPVYRTRISPVIGTHVGPHVLGVGVLPAL